MIQRTKRPLWKNTGKLQNSQAKKVVAVAYESFYYRALTGKILVFWIGGRLREVVAYERWSHMESQLLVLNLLKRLLSLQTPPLQTKKLVSWPFKLYPLRAMFIPKALS